MARSTLESPLRYLDPDRVSAAARSETRNREVYLPPIGTYRWWARRTEAVNGALIDAVNRDIPGRLLVADVFAGGGVIPLAAVIRGHRVYAQDLNPWATAGLAAMLSLPDPSELRAAAATLARRFETQTAAAYGTTLSDGSPGLVSHTFRVVTAECTRCGRRARLFPHALVSLLVRRERNDPTAFMACPTGHLFVGDSSAKPECARCSAVTDPAAAYTDRRRVVCDCGHTDRLDERAGTWAWEVVLVERSRPGHRELAIPREAEIRAADDALWTPMRPLGPIPDGQETRVLRRHGFRRWEQLYPNRQRVMLERLLDTVWLCSAEPAVVRALSMAVIGSAEMAGHLSRWDRYYLKSYEAMAGHRFNLTTLAVEPNAWGTMTSGRGTVLRRLTQLVKAASWFRERTASVDARVVEGTSERLLLDDGSVDLVLTDPPYHDDVQYSELSLPLRAWAELADGHLAGEAVVNPAMRHLNTADEYEALLARIFTEARRALRPGGHLIFSYANRNPEAWAGVFAALQRAGFRSMGCEIVHSENETDHAKRGIRACALDLILDLVPAGDMPLRWHGPRVSGPSDEVAFLQTVAATFANVGNLTGQWRRRFVDELRATRFLELAARDKARLTDH